MQVFIKQVASTTKQMCLYRDQMRGKRLNYVISHYEMY